MTPADVSGIMEVLGAIAVGVYALLAAVGVIILVFLIGEVRK